MIAHQESRHRDKPINRGLAPTAIFTATETVYGIAYRPVNKLAVDCCRLVGARELTPEQRIIIKEDIGFNFEVRRP